MLKILKLENFLEIFPDKLDLQKDDTKNNLWESDVEKCCNIRKVKPLNNFLKGKIKSKNSNLLFQKIGLGDQNKLRGSYNLKILFYHLQVDDKK